MEEEETDEIEESFDSDEKRYNNSNCGQFDLDTATERQQRKTIQM